MKLIIQLIMLTIFNSAYAETALDQAEIESARLENLYEKTQVPLDFNRLSMEQIGLIELGNKSDPTPYLMRSRPTVFQIVETGNEAHEVRYTGPITERAEVMIYALGEIAGDHLRKGPAP